MKYFVLPGILESIEGQLNAYFKENHPNPKNARLKIYPKTTGSSIAIRVYGENEKEVIEAKAAIESLLAGVVVRNL